MLSDRPPGPRRSLTTSDFLIEADGTDIVVTPSSSQTRRLTGHGTPVTALDLFPASGPPLLMSGSAGGSIRLWNLRTGDLVGQSQPCSVSVLLTFTGSDGRPRIASGGRTGKLRVWNPRLPWQPLTGLVAALTDVLQPGDADAPMWTSARGAGSPCSPRTACCVVLAHGRSLRNSRGPDPWSCRSSRGDTSRASRCGQGSRRR